MKIGSLTGQLNKWQAGIAWGKAPAWHVEQLHCNFWFIHVWMLKLTTLPKVGEMIQQKHFKGVRFYKEVPIT